VFQKNMTKGIIYVMTTAVSGLIKIGQTGFNNYKERMRNLEGNGYCNVAGLKQYFAIEVADYIDKEKLLHEIFAKHRVGESELFALDFELIKQLLLSFEGKIIFPKELNLKEKEVEFEKVVKIRKQSERFSFFKKGLKIGYEIVFCEDKTIKAIVKSEREVEFDRQIWKLSPLVYSIYKERNKLNSSGAYQGANYFTFDNIKLTKLPDIN
jgi:T5orf172 domain